MPLREKAAPVVKPGEFKIAVIGLNHGHIYGMCNGMTEAGADLKWVYDPDPEKDAGICRMDDFRRPGLPPVKKKF